MIFFSIILPTYNRASFLENAIKSVLSQTYTFWELIIVDDGSTDNTSEIVKFYQEKDSRICYIYQENAERSAARNSGIKLSVGDFITFMDSDGYFKNNHLLRIYQGIKNNEFKIGVYTFDIGFTYNNDKLKDYIRFSKEFINPVDSNELIQFILGAPQLCISRVILKHHRFNEKLVIGEDMELLFRITSIFNMFYIKGEITVFEMEHNNRSVNSRSISSLRQISTLKVMFSKKHPANRVKITLKNKLKSDVFFNASIDFFLSYNILALKYIICSIIFNPLDKKTKYKLYLIFCFLFRRKSLKRIIIE